jgi:hypothetical protein
MKAFEFTFVDLKLSKKITLRRHRPRKKIVRH